MQSSTHRRMSAMRARLAPLNGFVRPSKTCPLEGGAASTPIDSDALYGVDLSASENALIKRTFGSQERLTRLVAERMQETSPSKDLPYYDS